jgi:hypothetical protein
VNLWFDSSLSTSGDSTIMPVLAQMMPMIGNINSTFMCHHIEFGFSELGLNNAASQLLATMFPFLIKKSRILEIR